MIRRLYWSLALWCADRTEVDGFRIYTWRKDDDVFVSDMKQAISLIAHAHPSYLAHCRAHLRAFCRAGLGYSYYDRGLKVVMLDRYDRKQLLVLASFIVRSATVAACMSMGSKRRRDAQRIHRLALYVQYRFAIDHARRTLASDPVRLSGERRRWVEWYGSQSQTDIGSRRTMMWTQLRRLLSGRGGVDR